LRKKPSAARAIPASCGCACEGGRTPPCPPCPSPRPPPTATAPPSSRPAARSPCGRNGRSRPGPCPGRERSCSRRPRPEAPAIRQLWRTHAVDAHLGGPDTRCGRVPDDMFALSPPVPAHRLPGGRRRPSTGRRRAACAGEGPPRRRAARPSPRPRPPGRSTCPRTRMSSLSPCASPMVVDAGQGMALDKPGPRLAPNLPHGPDVHGHVAHVPFPRRVSTRIA
jgi:hypothetical protein